MLPSNVTQVVKGTPPENPQDMVVVGKHVAFWLIVV